MNKLLSVAIPTYNFALFLPETLTSLVSEAQELGIDVLVFDGNSTDNTREVVSSIQAKHPNLRYIKALSKGGIDLDMSKCVSYGSSEYCWLFSGDDLYRAGSFAYVLSLLKEYKPDLLLCRHNECDFDMRPLKDWPVLNSGVDKETMFDLSQHSDLVRYCDAAVTSEAFFSFMGGLIVKRRKWFEAKLDSDHTNKNWAHITRLWRLTATQFKLLYTPKVLLDRRGGNDSFSSDGMLERLKLQVYGLQHAVGKATSDPVVHRNLRRVVRYEIYPSWYQAVENHLKSTNAEQSMLNELKSLLASLEQGENHELL
ncbi:glycosyltransferase family 2 protein [Rhizobium mayense]|uniref:Glycosyltransferase n=1 Tax=Rhizobium mayense TaxID=1312184 RepID=A0ABT7K5M7_9HYPH|nr:glycosyltransferase [Rhizobium mayense]MDL2403911.1 glycosyltransferase [Rhizobium mayense]